MKALSFNESSEVSIGIELEFQIIDKSSFTLSSCAKEVLSHIKGTKYRLKIKPELTQSMIEINSSVHHDLQSLYIELHQIYNFLSSKALDLNITFCGGGTHPFQSWTTQEIYSTKANINFAKEYTYLAKRATVFGQHVHIGCRDAEDALYLTHALARFVPHFIALSASSPFYLGVDTGFVSTRTTVFNTFPLCGVVPFLLNWDDFSQYFHKMKRLGVIKNMNDFLWDIRPRPHLGTVEIRVCDTPLTLKKAILLGAYIQTLSLYLLKEKPLKINQDLYLLYNYNRFQASRYGFKGRFINPFTKRHRLITDDILTTLGKIKKYAHQLQNDPFLELLKNDVSTKDSDAKQLIDIYHTTGSLHQVVAQQCQKWSNSLKPLI